MTILSRRTLLGGLVTLPMVRPALAALQPYELLKDGTSVDFTFALSGITQSGTMPIQSADIQIDLRDLPNSRVAVVLSVAEARTKVPFARKPMLSESVLDAAAFPTIQFESTSILLGEGGRISRGAMVVGDLTLRGVTRPIALQANLFRERGSATDNLDDLSINLTGALNRHDFGASGYADLVQDTVGLDIQARIKRIG
ncbi:MULTISPECIES: YceI family protein [unclassified Ruegeria]|uniref:YceI family protein n=1 Tax=unclassified Ruegeria TaxID=2625375 RepID=UPI001489AC70|nr:MULTISPECIES: YceI family protein [unclassified Ruegeria]